MESSDIARRRMHRLANHVCALQHDIDISSLATLVCNAGSGLPSRSRKDNRLLYARQGSNYQACHMHENTGSQVYSAGSGVPSGNRKDNRLLYARQGSHTQAFYMRQSTGSQVVLSHEGKGAAHEHFLDTKRTDEVNHFTLKTEGEPHFSKPVSDSVEVEVKGYRSPPSSRQADEGDNKMQISELLFMKTNLSSKNNIGLEVFPHMDFMDWGSTYVFTVRLPGITVDDIRLEVNSNSVECRLIIHGTPSSKSWIDLNKIKHGALHHHRDTLQAPYSVVWHIPHDSNVDSITAEFIDGSLQIVVPKILP